MNRFQAQSYFASFGWSLRATDDGTDRPVSLHDTDGNLFGRFGNARILTASWLLLARTALAHEQSVEIALRRSKESASQSAAILEWAATGGATALPPDLDREINHFRASMRISDDASLVQGKRLASLIAREQSDITADVLVRIREHDRGALDSKTRTVSAQASPARL